MQILILRGTNFIGLAAALEAFSRGHEVTTFNRGTKPPPKGAHAIIGDRLSPKGYKSSDGLTFDTVLDTWQGDPIAVRTALAALRGRISHYIYISSISVYSGHSQLSEDSPVLDPESESKYGAAKWGGEIAAQELGPGVSVLIARPGLTLGLHENFDGCLT
jgi:2'-hydroxyisoflavone reductase